jgi:hypothetical protein
MQKSGLKKGDKSSPEPDQIKAQPCLCGTNETQNTCPIKWFKRKEANFCTKSNGTKNHHL